MSIYITNLTHLEHDTLLTWSKNGNKVRATRAVIILRSFEGRSVKQISAEVERSTKTVRKWIHLFDQQRLEGLEVVIPRKVPYRRKFTRGNVLLNRYLDDIRSRFDSAYNKYKQTGDDTALLALDRWMASPPTP